MASSTSPKTPPPADPVDEPAELTLTAEQWAAGNGPLQIPLAGLLADQPELDGVALTDSDWQARLDEYLKSPRPPHPTAE